MSTPKKKLGPLQSKKFIAYLIAEAGWKVALFYLMYTYGQKIEHYSFMVMMTLIIVSGFIQVGYILGQVALDKYTYLAESAIERGEDKPKG
ncbi:hypothetical protein CL629_02325 [bacterium]|nr:hypothetical protein [bacterium]|tara:strand:- start:1634 stop:1906 length:273 start_codon:yes stop_codon:yes gene_type:complete